MLGFAPISAQAISGSAFKVLGVAASLAAAGSIAFDGSGRIGAFTPISATCNVIFGGSARLIVDQAVSSTGSVTFGGTPSLRVAGKPIRIVALHENYTLRAMPANYDLTALSESFTLRGYR